jgi:hypothetical protein
MGNVRYGQLHLVGCSCLYYAPVMACFPRIGFSFHGLIISSAWIRRISLSSWINYISEPTPHVLGSCQSALSWLSALEYAAACHTAVTSIRCYVWSAFLGKSLLELLEHGCSFFHGFFLFSCWVFRAMQYCRR